MTVIAETIAEVGNFPTEKIDVPLLAIVAGHAQPNPSIAGDGPAVITLRRRGARVIALTAPLTGGPARNIITTLALRPADAAKIGRALLGLAGDAVEEG